MSDSRRTGTVANLLRRILIMMSKFRLPRFPISLDRWVWKLYKERRGSMLMKAFLLFLKTLKEKAMGKNYVTQMFSGKVHWINLRTYLTFPSFASIIACAQEFLYHFIRTLCALIYFCLLTFRKKIFCTILNFRFYMHHWSVFLNIIFSWHRLTRKRILAFDKEHEEKIRALYEQ